MALKVIPLEVKIEAIEASIKVLQKNGLKQRDPATYHALTSIAEDLRARADRPRGAALYSLEASMKSLVASRNPEGFYNERKMIAVANVIVAKWPSILQALENWGAEAAE